MAEMLNAKAKELFNTGKFPEALKEYKDAIARNKNEAKYYCNRGLCYIKLMEFIPAI